MAFDPSWKFRDYREGVSDILEQVPFDEAGYLSQVRTELASEYYERQVAQYLAANRPGVMLADLSRDGPIIPQIIDAAPDKLPFTVVGAVQSLDAVPLDQSHRVKLTLAQSGTTLLQQLLVLPEMSLERVTISYAAASGGQLTPELRLGGVIVVTGSPIASGSGVQLTLERLRPGR